MPLHCCLQWLCCCLCCRRLLFIATVVDDGVDAGVVHCGACFLNGTYVICKKFVAVVAIVAAAPAVFLVLLLLTLLLLVVVLLKHPFLLFHLREHTVSLPYHSCQ